MHASVRAGWHSFSTPLEGRVLYMYVDILGLVTTGVGNLIDPVEGALPLPWKHVDGTLADQNEIRAAWGSVKAQAEYLKKRHHKFAANITSLRLTDEDVDKLVENKLASNEFVLARAFPGWDGWPADAQLGALSMAWAMGPGFVRTFKNFAQYANAGDWVAASVACKIATVSRGVPNPGIIPRNRANVLCFQNAATVVELGLSRDRLWWPESTRAEADTVPPPTPRNDVPLIPLELDIEEHRRARDERIKEP